MTAPINWARVVRPPWLPVKVAAARTSHGAQSLHVLGLSSFAVLLFWNEKKSFWNILLFLETCKSRHCSQSNFIPIETYLFLINVSGAERSSHPSLALSRASPVGTMPAPTRESSAPLQHLQCNLEEDAKSEFINPRGGGEPAMKTIKRGMC